MTERRGCEGGEIDMGREREGGGWVEEDSDREERRGWTLAGRCVEECGGEREKQGRRGRQRKGDEVAEVEAKRNGRGREDEWEEETKEERGRGRGRGTNGGRGGGGGEGGGEGRLGGWEKR